MIGFRLDSELNIYLDENVFKINKNEPHKLFILGIAKAILERDRAFAKIVDKHVQELLKGEENAKRMH